MKIWYWICRIALYFREPYIPGKQWRYRLYFIRNYFRDVLPLDLAVARQLVKFTLRGAF